MNLLEQIKRFLVRPQSDDWHGQPAHQLVRHAAIHVRDSGAVAMAGHDTKSAASGERVCVQLISGAAIAHCYADRHFQPGERHSASWVR